MSGFKVNFSVNNQLSTPSIHAAPFAQRPAAGQPGRVFIDSDNPSTGIYRDTGTTWVAIGNPSSPDVDTLQIVTDRGNTTTNSITVGAATTPSGTVDVRRSTAALNGTNDWALLGVNTPTIPSGASFGVNYVNAVYGSQAQTFAGNATIGNAGLNSAGNFINTLGNSASGTITVAQGSGTIRAIAGLHAGIYYNTPNAMTFTHVAGIRTLQPINSGAVGASVTNYYGVQIADSTPASGTISYTNRFGIYQEGASDINYFAGRCGILTTSPTNLLTLVGSTTGRGIDFVSQANFALVVGKINYETTNDLFSIINTSSWGNSALIFGTSNTERARFSVNGNFLMGTTTDAGQRLQVSGTTRLGGDTTIITTTNSRQITFENSTARAGVNISQPNSTLTFNNGNAFELYSNNVSFFTSTNTYFKGFQAAAQFRYQNGSNVDAWATIPDATVPYAWGRKLCLTGGTTITTPNASAVLDIQSTTMGVLLPRMTDAQITGIATPANGLMAYSTDQNCPAFYDGTGWRKISHSAL